MSEFDWSTLAGWLNASFAENAEEIALEYGEEKITYQELDRKSAQIANWLQLEKRTEQFIGVYAEKTPFTYIAIAGIIRAGKAYVPINPRFPYARNKSIIELSGIKTIIAISTASAFIQNVQANSNHISFLHETVFEQQLPVFTPKIKKTDPAYLLFTSGSTGKPKGVLISHLQAVVYLENISSITMGGPGDKFSQTFDLTFDLSVHDIFCCLGCGATLCIPQENDLLSPANYIKKHQLTHWFSVPSLARMMDKLHQLKENNFPELKSVLFCGEALPAALAIKMLDALNENAEMYNLYGPTEATIAISFYHVTKDALHKNGNVCIGQIFEGHYFGLVENEDEAVKEQTDSPEENNTMESGELVLTGPQVIKNYFNNEEADALAFADEGNGIIWYKTGDLVEADADNNLFYLGRKDDQLKLLGYRMEAAEIEHLVCQYSGATEAVCFVKEGTSPVLVCAIQGHSSGDKHHLTEQLKAVLPAYMVPQQIVYLPVFPLNANGKTDRKEVMRNAFATTEQ